MQGLFFYTVIAYPMCFTRVSRCDVEITQCFTIPTPVRASKGAPKGAQKGPRTQKCTPGTLLAQIGRTEMLLLLIRVPFRTHFEIILDLKIDTKISSISQPESAAQNEAKVLR